MRIAQVKVIFTLPQVIVRPGYTVPAPTQWPSTPLAYVELYSPPTTPRKFHGMYVLSRALDVQGRRVGAVIPLQIIRQTCMLIPVFPTPKTAEAQNFFATSSQENSLEVSTGFLVNNYLSLYSYQTIW